MRGNYRNVLKGGVILAVIVAAGYLALDIFGGPPPVDPEKFIAKTVTARGETVPTGRKGNAADDPAIWVASNPERSLILGTDKQDGLFAFDLKGEKKAFLPVGRLNNVDLRPGFTLGGRDYVLVAATNRTERTVAIFLLDPETRGILRPYGGSIPLDVDDANGLCLYRSADETHHVIATGKDGRVRQFIIRPNEAGGVSAKRVRAFKLDSAAEGCVADDRTGRLYIAEEARGIWRYGANPGSGTRGRLIAKADGRELTEDVEGLALYPKGKRKGYLIASSQGDSTFSVFSLKDERLAGRFQIGSSQDGAVDEVTGTDGIEITSHGLPGYPSGLLIVQDDEDDGGRQNFKLVDWHDIETALELE